MPAYFPGLEKKPATRGDPKVRRTIGGKDGHLLSFCVKNRKLCFFYGGCATQTKNKYLVACKQTSMLFSERCVENRFFLGHLWPPCFQVTHVGSEWLQSIHPKFQTPPGKLFATIPSVVARGFSWSGLFLRCSKSFWGIVPQDFVLTKWHVFNEKGSTFFSFRWRPDMSSIKSAPKYWGHVPP